MIDFMLEPLKYDFMIRGLVAAVIVGTLCALIGTYVVLRGLAFLGNALAHSILPGVALGYLTGSGERRPLFWWALLAALFSAFGIGMISQTSKIKSDTAIGVTFAGMFALGIALISSAKNYTVDLVHILFGDILGVSRADLLTIGISALLIIAVIFAFYKEFNILVFDPVLAKTLRLPSKALNYLQLFLVAVAIVVSLQIVGIALMSAMLITPAALANLLSKRLGVMMVIAAVIGSLSGVIGLYLSYYAGIASGAAIVLIVTLLFLITWISHYFKTGAVNNNNV